MSDRLLGPRELARQSGVSTDTLRHYERLGLLPGIHRTTAGYRQYPAATVARVRLIQRALVVGFSLADLRTVLSERDRGGAPCRKVRDLFDTRLQDLDRRVDELIALRDELRALAAEWDARLAQTPAGRPAHLLESLGERPIIERAARSRPRGLRNGTP
jgi:DNA-binding transcriptional MerR regulator